MFDSHYEYFLKDLKRTCPQVSKHRRNSPIILANQHQYIKNVKDLVKYIFEALGVLNTVWVADYEMEDFEANFQKYVERAENSL